MWLTHKDHFALKVKTTPIIQGVVLIFTCLCLTLTGNAQYSLGIQAGLSRNYFATDISRLSYTSNLPGNGFTIGVQGGYSFNKYFSIKIIPAWQQKNYSFERTGIYAGIHSAFQNNYLQLPVMASFGYGNTRIKGFVNGGPYIAWWISGRTKGRIPDIFSATDSLGPGGQSTEHLSLTSFDEKYRFDSRKDRRLEAGFATGIGISYSLNKAGYLTAEVSYFHSLTDQQKNYMSNQPGKFNQVIAFTIGYIRKFNTRK